MSTHPIREVARLVLLDASGSILLVRYDDGRPGRPTSYWATPGGALEEGESHHSAAARELREETGLRARIGRELWEHSFDVDYGNGTVHQVERFFLARVSAVAPAVRNSSQEDIREHRWWSLIELQATRELIFPENLAASVASSGLPRQSVASTIMAYPGSQGLPVPPRRLGHWLSYRAEAGLLGGLLVLTLPGILYHASMHPSVSPKEKFGIAVCSLAFLYGLRLVYAAISDRIPRWLQDQLDRAD